jgi:FkbM family methyltransferase
MSIKNFFVGRKFLQPLFERLFRMSLRGMNYGLGGIISTSGEENLIKMVRHKLDQLQIQNKIVFDVGANNGQYADVILNIFDRDVQLYCFEPSAYSFQELKKKHGNNNYVELVPSGLGSTAEKRKLYFDSEGSGWASVFERKGTQFNHDLSRTEEIEIITLDEFCKSKSINRIHFLKADVEGFELEIFKGASQMLANIDFIQFEFSFANYNSKTYLLDFFELLSGFRIFRILKNGIQEIEYDPRYEILMTTNYLAVNKKITI